ncbi:MAG: hypothetical protein GX493_10855 [Firmicutes bacterium]|nr:hypothetical protein [Bacillota bacterium]
MRKRPPSSDPFGRFFFFFLLFLLAFLVAVQAALTVPSWRLKLNAIEVLEGVRLKGFVVDDLPSRPEIW